MAFCCFVFFFYFAIDEATHKFITYPYYFIFDVAFAALATGGDSNNNNGNQTNAAVDSMNARQ